MTQDDVAELVGFGLILAAAFSLSDVVGLALGGILLVAVANWRGARK